MEAKFTEANKNINKILRKYETKQPGEHNNTARFSNSTMKTWRIKQKIRYAQTQMPSMGLKGEQCKEVLHLIKEFPDFKKLCSRCKSETIIIALCFYVKFKYTQTYPLERYAITKEVGLTDKVYITILINLCRNIQSKMPISYVRYV